MNILEAINAHTTWVRRIEQAHKGTLTEELDRRKLERDDACKLGKWLHEEGKEAMSGNPHYEELLVEHAEFHTIAGVTVQLIEDGQLDQAEEAINDVLKPIANDIRKTLLDWHRESRLGEAVEAQRSKESQALIEKSKAVRERLNELMQATGKVLKTDLTKIGGPD